MWELPGPGIEPVSPALAGGFLTTVPPGKPPDPVFTGNTVEVALRHVGSSRTRARTRVPYIGRRILNHCATREVPVCVFLNDRDQD
ncbi:hypothetical protein J1605_021267 [Eschrichtius robustus]|uniref:Uncharacterized protein n=1 Tax=Eschrichtius robustus TaxID=9764 RepID=A0AB34HJE0_ESCRO|nr:hypothetical protein J1605_021267 [Eschrichtius robustus]